MPNSYKSKIDKENIDEEIEIKDKQITRIEYTLRAGQALPTDEVYIPKN